MVPLELSQELLTIANIILNKLDEKVDKETGKGLFSGSYNDLINKPTIPSDVSDLTDTQNTQFTPKAHEQSATTIKDPNSANYTDIGLSAANKTQQEINTAIHSKIHDILGLKFIEVVSNKGAASASTMNKLYIVSENGKTNAYYTKAATSNNTTTYSWQLLDEDILDSLVIQWSDIQNKPTIPTDVNQLTDSSSTQFTPKPHVHGNIQSDGTIKVLNVLQQNKNVVTDQNGNLIAEDKYTHPSTHTASMIQDSNSSGYLSIGNLSANANQQDINSAINTKLSNIVSSIPSAVTIDSDLSNSSTNLLQNKKIYESLNDISTELSSPFIHMEADKSIIQTGELVNITATLLSKDDVSEKTIAFKNGSNILGTSITDDTGRAFFRYTGKGIGEIQLKSETSSVQSGTYKVTDFTDVNLKSESKTLISSLLDNQNTKITTNGNTVYTYKVNESDLNLSVNGNTLTVKSKLNDVNEANNKIYIYKIIEEE